MVGGYRFYECPASYMDKDTYELIDMYYLSEGLSELYFQGSISEQPNWYVEVLKIGKRIMKEKPNG